MVLFRRKQSSLRRGSKGSESMGSEVDVSTATLTEPVKPRPQPSLDGLPQLVSDLRNLRETAATSASGAQRAARVLGRLFALSEHDVFVENRIHMALREPMLVPTLLEMAERAAAAAGGTREPYYLTTLLVLNNLCIPMETKRTIIMEYEAVPILCRLLAGDASCHLVAIILVNLTFCDYALRLELLQANTESRLLESLAFALRMACLTPSDYQCRLSAQRRFQSVPVQDLWKTIMETECSRTEASDSDSILDDANKPIAISTVPVPTRSKQVYPETVRWTMTALKNLSRPGKEPAWAPLFVSLGIVPLVCGFLAVDTTIRRVPSEQTESTSNSTAYSSDRCDDSSSSVPCSTARKTAHPGQAKSLKEAFIVVCPNSPARWDASSAQDAALMILVNLSAMPCAREYLLRDIQAVRLLSTIANYGDASRAGQDDLVLYQRVKAKMGLAYLLGSEGHFGQPEARLDLAKYLPPFEYDKESLLKVTEPEVTKLVKILAYTLHRRCDQAPSGYSPHTFSVKYVLYAIRCLLTQYKNQLAFVRAHGTALNALLTKVLAQHALLNVIYVDAEAAEYASFSLYLLSSHCFNTDKGAPFLPLSFTCEHVQHSSDVGMRHISDWRLTKILKAYSQRPDITPAGKHAAEQLMKRAKYLLFHGKASDLAKRSRSLTAQASDFELDTRAGELLRMMVLAEPVVPGTRPNANIFHRPLLRRYALSGSSPTDTLEWDNERVVDPFFSALQAAQDLSYDSRQVRHMDAIDDVRIANNIAHSAMGEKTESYNFMWSWQDQAQEIQRKLEREGPSELMMPCNTAPEPESGPPSLSILDKVFGTLYIQ